MWFLSTLLFVSLLGKSLAVTRQDIYDLIQTDRYDGNEHPPPKGEPTDVKVGIYVNSLTIDRKNQQLVWGIYLRQSWNDSRLSSKFNKDDDPITMGNGHWKDAWHPDIFFRNSLEVTRDDKPAEQTLLRLSHDGSWFVQKLKLTTSCYGFERRLGVKKLCPLMIESFKYTEDQLTLSWLNSPVDFDPDIRLGDFTLLDKILHDCSQNYTAGAFPCLEIRMLFEEDVSSAVMTAPRLAFAIGIFLVIVSWLSFWIDGDKIVERLGVLFGVAVTILLLGIGMHVQDDLDTPNNSNYKFIGGFMFFVVAAMLEYVIVYGAMQWIPAKIKEVRKGDAPDSSSPNRLPRIIDIACGLVIFPVVFLLFVFFYAFFNMHMYHLYSH